MVYIDKKSLKPLCNQFTSGQYYLTQKRIKGIIHLYKNGHRCEKCGAMQNLTFHHTIPEKKKYNISDMWHKFETITLNNFIKEINQCELLCDKCHREIKKELQKKERKLWFASIKNNSNLIVNGIKK